MRAGLTIAAIVGVVLVLAGVIVMRGVCTMLPLPPLRSARRVARNRKANR